MSYASSEQLSHFIQDLEQEVASLHGDQAHPALIHALERRIGALRMQLHAGTRGSAADA